MKPIKTQWSNLVYRGPTPDIDDLPCRRHEPGLIVSTWTFTPEERQAIAGGANLELWIYTEPIPPVALQLTNDQEANDAKAPAE
jgi:hypothetical protein